MKHLIFLGIMVCIVAACKNNSDTKQTAATTNAIDTVPAFILHDTSIAKSIELPAELLPYEQSQLFARVQGYVKDMKVDIGDKVHRGQILVLIEAPELNTKQAEYQSALGAAKAKYMSSNDMYQRLNKASQANTPGIVAPADLTRSRNQLLADSASYESAKQLAQYLSAGCGFISATSSIRWNYNNTKCRQGSVVETTSCTNSTKQPNTAIKNCGA